MLVGTQIVATIQANETLNEVLGPSIFGVNDNGMVLGVSGELALNAANPVYEHLVVGDRRTQRVDTSARMRATSPPRVYARRPGGSARQSPPALAPLESEDQAVLFRDGWIAVARYDPYRVDWRDPGGSWIQGKPINITSVRVTNRFKCFALAGYSNDQANNCDANADARWPELVPPFLRRLAARGMKGAASMSFLATPDGNVLLRRTPSLEPAGNRYDLIDRGGELKSVLVLPPHETVIGFGDDDFHLGNR